MVFFISVLVLNGSCLTLALRVLEYLARENYYTSIPEKCYSTAKYQDGIV